MNLHLSEANPFEVLRAEIPLMEVASRVAEPKRVGDKHLLRCVWPDHEDHQPSLYLYSDGHFFCFGCRRHGDVTDLWAIIRGLDPGFEAALDLAREYSIPLPESDPEADRRARVRRQREDDYLEQSLACHQELSRHPSVVEWWKNRGFGRDLQEQFLLGANRDGTQAMIPYWNRGRVQGLIRRKLEGAPKYSYPEVEAFPSGYRPLFVPGPVIDDVFLVEGIIDALALAALGRSAVAVGGTSISSAQMQELRRISGQLYILPDADEEGKRAAREWARELYPTALLCPAEYGEEVGHA